MSARPNLQVWAATSGAGELLAISLLCTMHAGWSRDSDFWMPRGLRVFRVRQRALVREMLRRESGCAECAFRTGKRLTITDASALATLTQRDLEQEGGEA